MSEQNSVGSPNAQLYEISKIEHMINEVAKRDAALKRFGLNPDHYRIRLVWEMDSIMKISAGHVVQIWLKWPESYGADGTDIPMHIHNAFRMINRHRLHRTMEVVPWMATRLNNQKWVKEHFKDESEIIFDLIPKNRLKVERKLVTTMTDLATGEVVKTETENDKYADEVEMRIILSRIVRTKYGKNGDDGGNENDQS